MFQLIIKVIFIITFFVFGSTQAYAEYTHIAASAPMIDSDTLDENSAVSIDNTLEDGKRIVFTGSYDSIFANIPADSGSLNAIYIGILKAGHTLSRVDDEDFEFAYKFYHEYGSGTRRVQATVVGGYAAIAATNLGTDRDIVLFHDFSVSGKFFGTNTPGVTAGTGASMTTPTLISHSTSNVSTADLTIVIASSGPQVDISTLTFSEVNNPTVDTTAPTMAITSSEVSDGDTSNDGTLSLTFTSSEATTDFAEADITVSGGALSSFSATSSTVYTATFTPSGAGATTIDVASSTFTDAAGNNNTAATQFNWTYNTNTAPTLSSSSPSDGSTGFGGSDNIVLTFSEAVDAETGNIVIKKSSDDSTVETIDVTSALVSGSGTTTITINPSTTLSGNVGYYITIDATAFDDADGGSYAGISDSTTLNFTTGRTDPLTDKDVVGLIEAQTEAPMRILQNNTTPILNRMDWLRGNRNELNLANQNLNIQFPDETLSTLSKTIPVDDAVINDASSVPNSWSFWSEGTISVGRIGDTSLSSTQEINTSGLIFGMDKRVNERKIYGYAFQYGRDEVEVGTTSSSLDTDTFSLSRYTSLSFDDQKYIDSIVGISSLQTDHIRKSGSNSLTGQRDGTQVFGSISFLTIYSKDNFNITPNGRINLGYTELLEYKETGTDALIYDKQKILSGMTSAGLKVDNKIEFENITLKPRGHLEYSANLSPTSKATVSYVSDPNTDYTLSFDVKDIHSARAGLGFDILTKNGWSVTTSYERDQSQNFYRDSIYFGASYIPNKKTSYEISSNDGLSINYNKRLGDCDHDVFDFMITSNYNLANENPNYAIKVGISDSF